MLKNQQLKSIKQSKINLFINIMQQRISWLGHLERMEEDRMSKKIFTQELEGTRRRGRPRKGWKEEVGKGRKCCKMDKKAKDKLVRSPRENGGG